MFAKAFRVKSNTVVKGSDRRKLKADISAAFPTLSAEELSELVPNKEELNVVKIYTHKGDAVTLYVLHKNPLFFELEKQLYPTVYMLWHHPVLLPAFTTWPPVLEKLIGGADLMLPGVVVPSGGLPNVKQGDCCAVTLVNSGAPVAVGTAAVSSAEMTSLGMKGRGVCILHTYMDHLWGLGDKSSPPPLPVAENEGEEMCEEDEEVNEEDEAAEKCADVHSPGAPHTNHVCGGVEELSLAEHVEEKEKRNSGEGEEEEKQEEEKQDDQKTPQERMDALLFQCFLHALKSKVKKSELPLLTSTFLRNHMFSCCPSGSQLDIKKSSYKKLSKFLQAMQQQHSLLQVKELTKGVESIVEVNWKNPQLRSFHILEEADVEVVPLQDGGGETPYHPPEITTVYSVSARTEPLFLDANKRKGTILQPAEVRSIITEYIKKNELVNEHNKNYVTINPILCDCLLEKSEYQEVESVKWDDLFSRTLGRMQEYYQVVFPGQAPMIKKGHIEPIDISVASRGSNKKVTLIRNLEVYGLDPAVVSAALQHKVQASSILQPIPGGKDKVMVQIQGNQIQQVGNLLLDHYQIPRKYIQGLDKAPKGGKKK
ncbi:eukaryotic translation initiation factor 2D [Thalassophryne amazonica]|uniref:eukaryotic translation initiation factor 2D n=1 Tax=Thalassophryne amazonica TaxID=390379 RepID=UPI00147216A2|nr:eukaryotic translation initiation factor 2D [Thalassophryne amazonica]